jgi:hypothetical protein
MPGTVHERHVQCLADRANQAEAECLSWQRAASFSLRRRRLSAESLLNGQPAFQNTDVPGLRTTYRPRGCWRNSSQASRVEKYPAEVLQQCDLMTVSHHIRQQISQQVSLIPDLTELLLENTIRVVEPHK